MKMKTSVIFGVAQMSLGIFMKAFNAIHFGRSLDFFFEFLPQITLLMCLFGWMDLLIIAKWLQSWPEGGSRAPNIIGVIINMFLKFGENPDNADSIIGGQTATVQKTISMILLAVGLICVPLMLFVKPLVILCTTPKHENHVGHGSNRFERVSSDEDADGHEASIQHVHDMSKMTAPPAKNDINLEEILKQEAGDAGNHAFSEIFIHQLIETIEFVLGTVSNTASYLRLWALSLAHGQLAKVFFEKLLGDMAFSGKGSPIMLFLLAPAWASASLFVLLCMDSMECFLHTLRLHWVEFQNKFYKGNGYRFVPFAFATILEEEKNRS